jgi:hypothetical protein
MDPNRVTTGELIAGASGLLLFVFMFLPWYGGEATVSLPGGGDISASVSDNVNAWEAFPFIDLILFLAAVIAVAMAIARAVGAMPADLPAPAGLIAAVAGTVAVILILYRLIDTPGVEVSGPSVDFDISPKIGIFLSLIAAAGITFGGYTAMNERAEEPHGGRPAA